MVSGSHLDLMFTCANPITLTAIKSSETLFYSNTVNVDFLFIEGTNFYSDDSSQCQFYDSDGNLAASVTSSFYSHTLIKCSDASLSPGTYEVKYMPNDKSGDLYANNLKFEIISRPVIYTVDKQLAKIGDTITVTGSNFHSGVTYYCSF